MLDQGDLKFANNHWAVKAIPEDARRQALESAKSILATENMPSGAILLGGVVQEHDRDLLTRVAFAYELVATEGAGQLTVSPATELGAKALEAQAAAFIAFDLLRAIPMPNDIHQRIIRILHLCALGYCCDRWSDVRRWIREHPDEVARPDNGGNSVSWDTILIECLEDCWIRLFRKNGWNDLDGVIPQIVKLRSLQVQLESEYLEINKETAQWLAFRLIALYHWAKATELLATFMLQGQPRNVKTELDQQFEAAKAAINLSGDHELAVLLQWLHLASLRMVSNSVWSISHAVDPSVSRFLESVTQSRAMFELLPPQQAAIQKQGLLDPASKAIVVDLPTSGGKTILAQFRILQALNQFANEEGWVAYVAPTRALVSQITKRLRVDFEPLGIYVEHLTAAVSLDQFEQELLSKREAKKSFHVLVATPEKLQMIIRNQSVSRPLILIVMDEAQNIEDPERGLRIELLLATAKRECHQAKFMLLMPYVPNSKELAEWLEPDSGKAISLSTSAWQPNERVVGMYSPIKHDRGDWSLDFEILETGPKSLGLKGNYKIPGPRPINISFSDANGSKTLQTAAIAKHFAYKGTSVAISRTPKDCWTMARTLASNMPELLNPSPEIELVKKFLATEISPNFELIKMLDRGIAVHHSGLSDEARFLIEWLAEEDKLAVMCATTTLVQGLNFPVSSVFLSSIYLAGPRRRKMSERMFWNLAGRAGRIDHGSVGVIGLAAGDDADEIREFVTHQMANLRSRLLSLLESLDYQGQLSELETLIFTPDWEDFRAFVAHIVHQAKDKERIIDEAELVLRNTFGYDELRRRNDSTAQNRAQALVRAMRFYAGQLKPNEAALVDSTGFSPEGVRAAISQLSKLERKLTVDDWNVDTLFGTSEKSALNMLVGVMMNVPQLSSALNDIQVGGEKTRKIGQVSLDWVSGKSIEQIAAAHFSVNNNADTTAITAACQGIYKSIGNFGTWGLSALSKLPNSGIQFDKLSAEQIMEINRIPAMLYHGVRTNAAVLMRINSVPRSIAENVGQLYSSSVQDETRATVRNARDFVLGMSDSDWNKVLPSGSKLSGKEYLQIWQSLTGKR